ncbi:hypothetical protein Ancab_001210 [Ancistrocladus abbreviatus]
MAPLLTRLRDCVILLGERALFRKRTEIVLGLLSHRNLSHKSQHSQNQQCRANLAHFGRRDRENFKRQALHNNVTNNGITKRGATTGNRNARLKSYADAVRHSEDGLTQKKITKQPTYNQYGQHQFDLEASLCEADFSWLQDCYVGEIKSMELLEGLQDMQRLAGLFSCQVRPLGGMLVLLSASKGASMSDTLSPAEYPPAPMKQVQDNSPSMANSRMEDDLSHLQIEKDGLVAGKMPKSLTPIEEPTKAGGKVLPHVPRCSGSGLFSADLEAIQSRFFVDPPSPAFQYVLGLSTLMGQEVLDPQ